MPKIRTIETARLKLVPVGTLPNAVEDYTAVFQKTQVTEFMEKVPEPYAEEDARIFIKKTMVDMASGVVYVWDVIWADDSSSRIIGNLAYAFKSEGVFSRGFWVDSDFHGQGIMPEAVAVTTDFMFDEVGVQKIFVRNASANFKSHRVQEKTGCLYLWRFPRQDSCKGIEEEEHWELGPERWREWKVSHPEMDIPFGYRTSE